MDVLVAKIIAAIVLFVITVVVGLVPYWIIRRKGKCCRIGGEGLNYMNCFAGGVFLGACLLHLFVEGNEELEAALAVSYNSTTYPIFHVLSGCGFFMIAIVEQLTVMCMGGLAVKSVMRVNGTHDHLHRDSETKGKEHGKENMGFEDEVCQSEEQKNIEENCKELDKEPLPHSHGVEAALRASGVRVLLLLIALSFHTIFDGLAIGLQESEEELWEIFIAIAIHKLLAAFCLGLQLFRAFQKSFKKPFGFLFLFSLISPIGLTVGIFLTSSYLDQEAEKLASGTLQALAAGTFLYVTCFEILKDQIAHGAGLLKVGLMGLGFAAMAGVKAIDSH